MVDTVATTDQTPEVAQRRVLDFRTADRPGVFLPIFKIEVDGIPLKETGHNSLVEEVYVEEIDEGLDLLEIKFADFPISVTNDEFFREGTKVKVWTGYKNTGIEFRGNFIMQRPKFKFQVNAGVRIEMKADGEGILLSRDQKRRIFSSRKHSEIASIFAGENGLETDIEETNKIYSQLSQMNETDMDFLRKLARFHGFVVYVDRGVLNFHSIRNDESNIALTFGVELSLVHVELQGEGRSIVLKAAQFDPNEGKIINVESKIKSDGTLDIESEKGIRKTNTIASTRTTFMVQEGHLLDNEELQTQVDAMANSRKFIVRLKARGYGVRKVRAREIIEIRGIGRFNGKYYVNRVVHRIKRGSNLDSSGYTMELDAVRAFTGDLIPSPSDLVGIVGNRRSEEDVTDKSVAEGELNLVTGAVETF